MKTKQRILQVSLELFNRLGEPNVTTVDISNEMEISPGNLYYHYRNKDDIIEHLVATYERDLKSLLNAEAELDGVIEHWLFLKLIIEKNDSFRFIFRDCDNLAGKYKQLDRKVSRLHDALHKAMLELVARLTNNQASHADVLAENMVCVLTRIPFFYERKSDQPIELAYAQTAFHTMLALWSYLSTAEQTMLEELLIQY